MTIDEFLERADLFFLYHFTDVENLPLIREHGLLSYRELQRRGIQPPKPGGNDVSHGVDTRRGLDQFVHLCLKDQHPMEYVARQEGRIGKTIFLKISCEVLRGEGVCGCPTVANRGDAVIRPLEEALDDFDMEVLFDKPTATVLADKDLKRRYNEAKKTEILVPTCIPRNLIVNFTV